MHHRWIVEPTGELASWNPLVTRWSQLLHQFEQGEIENESSIYNHAYWYCERTNCAHLASAAVAIGGVALTEYSIARGCDSHLPRGYGDLYLRFDEPEGPSRRYLIEAKQPFPEATEENIRIKIESARQEARNQLRTRNEDPPHSREVEQPHLVELIFLVPWLEPSWRPEHGLDDADEIVRSIGGWHLAARFPEVLDPGVRRPAFYKEENRCYPAVYLLASELPSTEPLTS